MSILYNSKSKVQASVLCQLKIVITYLNSFLAKINIIISEIYLYKTKIEIVYHFFFLFLLIMGEI